MADGAAGRLGGLQLTGPLQGFLGGLQDLGRGTVIFPQGIDPQPGDLLGQLVKAGGAGAPEPINGLIRVADQKHGAPRLHPVADQFPLHRVDILHLIHQQVGKRPVSFGVLL